MKELALSAPGARTTQDAPPSEFYIPATESLSDTSTRTLKHADTFGIFDRYGDIVPGLGSPEGLFHDDTRYLSSLQLLVNGKRPLLLSSKIEDNNAALSVDLTNPDLLEGHDGIPALQRDMVHILRSKFLWRGGCYERLGLRNFSAADFWVDLEFVFDADFADIFEVRGKHREKRGKRAIEVSKNRAIIAYRGLDDVMRRTVIDFDPHPTRLDRASARHRINLRAGGRASVFFVVRCMEGEATHINPPRSFLLATKRARRELRSLASGAASVETSNDVFNEVLCRAMADLYILVTETEHGPFPYAGVPWFSTNFGRDSIITAMETLWIDPAIARGVLKYLAATQARETRPEADAEPGKVIHEMRRGEMARLGEVPFARYYGSVDGTPLFVMLAGLYFDRTSDLETISELWSSIEAALHWIDRYGDRDGDGFVEYFRADENGLVNQGWKDSSDSVFHADGALAQGPIALCEVQGYVFAAKRAAAKIAEALGHTTRAKRLEHEAQELAARFDDAFWCEEIGTYAIALDGDKRRCAVRSSNAGHLLFTGIVPKERAAEVGEQLLKKPFFSGWGVRTIAAGEARYNPMSYHNGSIWPHDNALIGLGMERYGLKHGLQAIFSGLFEAACYMDLRRLPELFCGFQRMRGKGPTLYPVACTPQAWSSCAPFALLQASLGLEFECGARRVRLRQPRLPPFLDEVIIRSLAVGDARVDLLIRRHGADISVSVLRSEKESYARVEVTL
jgi:glycogen debranching enzyme